MMDWPVYAPLRVTFDKAQALNEVNSIKDTFDHLPPKLLTVEDPKRYWQIAPTSWYEKCWHWIDTPTGKTKVQGTIDTWKGVNLKTIDGVEGALGGSAVFAQGHRTGEWKFRDDLLQRAPYLCSIVSGLPYEYVDVARIMTLQPGAFGPVHIDKDPITAKELFEDRGLVGLTIQIDDGGVPMQAVDRDGTRFDIWDPAFFFLDSVAHGVESPKWQRVTLRLFGKANETLFDYLDMEKAIW